MNNPVLDPILGSSYEEHYGDNKQNWNMDCGIAYNCINVNVLNMITDTVLGKRRNTHCSFKGTKYAMYSQMT